MFEYRLDTFSSAMLSGVKTVFRKSLSCFSVIFLSIIFFAEPLLAGACDFEEKYISLVKTDEPLQAIFHDVSLQTGLAFQLSEKGFLAERRSIILHDASIGVFLQRLMRHSNYVAVCEPEKRLVTVTFFGGVSGNAISSEGRGGTPGVQPAAVPVPSTSVPGSGGQRSEISLPLDFPPPPTASRKSSK